MIVQLKGKEAFIKTECISVMGNLPKRFGGVKMDEISIFLNGGFNDTINLL